MNHPLLRPVLGGPFRPTRPWHPVFPETAGVGHGDPKGTLDSEEKRQGRGNRPHCVPREPELLGCNAEVPPPGAIIHSGQTPLLYGRNGMGETICGDTLSEFVEHGYHRAHHHHPHTYIEIWGW